MATKSSVPNNWPSTKAITFANQQVVNKHHHIKPKTISKSVAAILQLSIPGSGSSISNAIAKLCDPIKLLQAERSIQAVWSGFCNRLKLMASIALQ